MTFKTLSIEHVLVAMVLVAPACKRDATEAPETTAVAEQPPTPETTAEPLEQPADTPPTPVPEDRPAENVAATEPTPADTTAPADPPAGTGGTAPVAAAGLPAALHSKIDDKCGRDAGVNTSALPFALKTADGKDISMASLKGKVVLLNFWGTWCKPCLQELPEFDRLVRHYKKQGVVLVAIATDTEPEKVLEFGKERKIAGKLVLGGEDLAKKYDSPNFPFSFVVDAKGTIRGSYRSYKPECIGKIEQDIRSSLEQRAK